MRRSFVLPAASLIAAISLTACGGGGGSPSDKPTTSASPTSTFNPSRGASMQLAGTVATGAPLPGTPITVYDASGKVCSQTVSNASGAYSISATPTSTPWVSTWMPWSQRYRLAPQSRSIGPSLSI